MAIDSRYKVSGVGLKRDIRPWTIRIRDWARRPDSFVIVMLVAAMHLLFPEATAQQVASGSVDLSASWGFFDIILVLSYFYFRWVKNQSIDLPLRLPTHAGLPDKNNPTPTGKPGKSEGILFLGNVRDGSDKGKEVWITNSDARTHILLLGTTGAGKSEALKSFVTNALIWGSGCVYVDGKAQNTLWGDVYSLARRFGRDDDVLVLNYMTGNSDNGSRSNSLNPFSIGSASYLTQMMTGLMDDAGGDNAMWKGRAISLISALMPALTWKRDHQGMLMDVGVIRDHISLEMMIKMSRDVNLPDKIIRGLQSYLETLPGYVDSAFDDEGREKPPSNDQPMVDLSQTRQQHGYLTMQFTRSLSSLADEYGYVFKQQMADIDMMDVVLNRRILVVLIPALEKSPDEAANLGKIVVAALKGMMGATLGAELEGEQSSFIDNNPTTGPSPFLTIFDEVGYYTSPGMGVMAAQARSLGFCLVFAGQDMPALQKRVKEEALSIVGNCNLKIFGKLEDPTETKDFFEKTVSSALVSEVSGFSSAAGAAGGKTYREGDNITFQARKEASYDDLKKQGPGQFYFLWADKVVAAKIFYAEPKRVEVVRVQRLIGVTSKNWAVEAREKSVGEVASHLRDPDWFITDGPPAQPVSPEFSALLDGLRGAAANQIEGQKGATLAVGCLLAMYSQRGTQAVSAPGLDTPDSGFWPFGSAAGAGAPEAPLGASSAPPPWMAGAPAASAAPPAGASAASPPWMGGTPAASATGAPPPPPWMSAAPASPPPVATAPLSPTSPPWMAGAATPQIVTATPTPPPPPWMTGAAPLAQPPQQQGAQATVPPWQQQPQRPMPQQQPASPPWAAPAQPQQPASPPWAAPAQPQQPATPPWAAPAQLQQPATPPWAAPAQPQQPATPPWAAPAQPQQPATPPWAAPAQPQQAATPPWAAPAQPQQPATPPWAAPAQPQQPATPPWAAPAQPQQPATPPWAAPAQPQQPATPPWAAPAQPQPPEAPLPDNEEDAIDAILRSTAEEMSDDYLKPKRGENEEDDQV